MEALWEAVERRVREFHAAQGGAHLVMGLVRGGRVDRCVCLGAGTDSVFRIASMTKSFTAAAVLQLRDAGKLRLDDAAEKHVPQFASVGRATEDSPVVTIRHLLSMGSGLATDDPWADRLLDISPDSMSHLLLHEVSRFAVPTGEVQEYSNFGYAVLGRIIRAVSGLSFQDYITQFILRPLGMHRTTWLPPNDAVLPGDGAAVLGDGEIASMGGLWSCASDLAKWIEFLGSAFPARNDPEDVATPLSRASRREMQRVQQMSKEPMFRMVAGAVKETALGYGFGLRVGHHAHFGSVASHSGGLPGYGSHMRWWHDGSGLGLVALCNKTYAEMWTLLALCLDDFATAMPAPTPPIAGPEDDLYIAMQDLLALSNWWDEAAARRLFAFNVFLDRPNVRADVQQLYLFHLVSLKRFTGTRGEAVLANAAGTRLTLSVLLAPLKERKLQHWKATPLLL